RGVVLLDHLDAGAAVLGDLVDVGSFHQAQTDIGMAQAVCRPALSDAVELEILLGQNRVELCAVVAGKQAVGRLWLVALGRRRNGVTAPVILLQYPTPRLPRTSMSRIVSPVASSSTISTSRYSSRAASSGRRPVLAMNST